MFDGLPDQQFHQFILSRTSLPLPLSFPLHPSPSPNTFPPYDPYNPSPHHQLPLQPTHGLLHPPSPPHKHHHEDKQLQNNLEIIQRDDHHSPVLDHHPWSNDEVLSLLRIRSSVENWLPDFTWEHVSRKLSELGFKRSPEKCKEKYEEESRYFNNNINFTKSYRFLSELEELYHEKTEKPNDHQGEDDVNLQGQISNLEADSRRSSKGCKKRKRKRKKKEYFEMLKGLCEKIVSNMMAQQEEMHKKLLEDMVKRDEEKIAKEEAWKKQEMDRLNRELDSMAHEQAIAGDRQSTIIRLLKHFTSTNTQNDVTVEEPVVPVPVPVPQNPSQLDSVKLDDDVGKRWPRDEVLALINLRCSLYSNVDDGNIKELPTKAPLWERISQGMLEMGYKRSAKRCKEKWENINKYFRKTKDVNKKRSVDSRTCPYFHQLNALYNQGTLVAPPPSEAPENRSNNHSPLPQIVNAEGEKNMAQVPSFDFEF